MIEGEKEARGEEEKGGSLREEAVGAAGVWADTCSLSVIPAR